MNVAVFSVDPGGTTGIAWGIFDPGHADGAPGALRTRMNAGSTSLTGDERTQLHAIATLWKDFYNACVRSALLPPDRVWLVFEDFVLAPGETGGGREMGISTAIIWGVEGYRMGRRDEWQEHKRGNVHMPPLILQKASQASSYATNARLKEWGVWVVGREHERSAWRHIALFLTRFIQQFG